MNAERFLDILFLSTVICFFVVLSLVLFEARKPEEPACECREWVNLDQDIKCYIKRDDRKYGQKGRTE